MCIRDRFNTVIGPPQFAEEPTARNSNLFPVKANGEVLFLSCLLYTSDAADERSSVDLGGRRIIKKKKNDTDGGLCILNKKTQNRSQKQ